MLHTDQGCFDILCTVNPLVEFQGFSRLQGYFQPLNGFRAFVA
jgi:hypothetical protein